MATTVSQEQIKEVKGIGFLLNKGTDLFNGRIITKNGKINAHQTAVIAESAEKFGNGDVEFTARMTVEVGGIPYEKIHEFRAFIKKADLETGGTGAMVRPVVSCKGTTCHFGLCDTFKISEEIHERFYEGYRGVKLPHKFKIAVGGCPNNCVKPDLNDLGIVGQLVPTANNELCRNCKKCQIEINCPMKSAKLEEGGVSFGKTCNNCGRCVSKCPFGVIKSGKSGWKVYVGGRWGKKIAIARPLSKLFFEEEELYCTIEKVMLFFKEEGIAGERLAETIERVGFEQMEEKIYSNELLQRKEEILSK